MTRKNCLSPPVPSIIMKSTYFTRFGCEYCWRILASLRNRSDCFSEKRYLTATSMPSATRRPLKTSPKPPRPRTASSSYSSLFRWRRRRVRILRKSSSIAAKEG